jgi:hypothetical protein
MGFLDNVKAAAKDLTDSVDEQLTSTNAGRDAERHYRDLGMLAYLKETGRPVDAADWARVLGALKEYEAHGALGTFVLHTAPVRPPAAPPPGPPPNPPTRPPVF